MSALKAVIWMGSSKADLIAFPSDARREAGYQLEKVQFGDDPQDWKPMSSVGPGVREIRVREPVRCIPRHVSRYASRSDLRPALFSEKEPENEPPGFGFSAGAVEIRTGGNVRSCDESEETSYAQ